jgi:hypothetical protein
MFAAIAAFAFGVALLLDLFGVSKGHLNENTLVIVGLLCIALHLIWPTWWSSWRGRTAA